MAVRKLVAYPGAVRVVRPILEELGLTIMKVDERRSTVNLDPSELRFARMRDLVTVMLNALPGASVEAYKGEGYAFLRFNKLEDER